MIHVPQIIRGALVASKRVVVEFNQWLQDIDAKLYWDAAMAKEELENLWRDMIQARRWGNATGRLLLLSVTVEKLQSRQGRESQGLVRGNVVDDDIEEV
jgi:hypothetical protein